MEAYNHVEYMEAIASKLREINHGSTKKAFAVATTINLFEGFIENLNSINLPALIVLDDLASRLSDNGADNTMDIPYYHFIILDTAEINNAESQNEARRDCKLLAKKVLSRMFKDQRECKYGLNVLDRSSISFEGVGPIGDGACGCIVSFTLQEHAKIKFSGADWIDYDS